MIDLNEAAKALAEELFSHPMFSRTTIGTGTQLILKHFQKFTEGMEQMVRELQHELDYANSLAQCRVEDLEKLRAELEGMEKRYQELHVQFDATTKQFYEVREHATAARRERDALRTERDQLTQKATDLTVQRDHYFTDAERLKEQRDQLAQDKKRLDWLESKTDGSSWVARESYYGRGYRLHNTGRDSSDDPLARGTARGAIDAALQAQLAKGGGE